MLHILCDVGQFCNKLYYFVCADWSLGCLHPSLYASSADAGKIVLMVYTKRNLLEIYDTNKSRHTIRVYDSEMHTCLFPADDGDKSLEKTSATLQWGELRFYV